MHFSHFRPGSQVVRATERSRREGGYVLAMFGLLLVPLLLMVGLAVDVGSWYNRASDIQKAADAASLAGVVWLPDEAKARSVALDVAKKNGFDNAHPDITVTVNKSTKAPRRLKVTIEDRRVGSFFYQNLGGREISVTRDSFAEYVTPVPMGSPRNFFGLGTLLVSNPVTDMPAEYLFQSVNPYCTDKENGDRYQSMSDGGTCDTNRLNDEYRTSGYEMYIDAPATRTSDIEVRLYDPRYNQNTYNYTVPGPPSCVSPGPQYPADPNAGWINGTGTSNITVRGPVEYQTKTGSTAPWGPTQTRNAGQNVSHRGDRIRFRSPLHTWPGTWEGPASSGTSNLTVNGLARYQTRTSNTTNVWTSTLELNPSQSTSVHRRRIRYMYPTYQMLPEECTPTTVGRSEGAIDSFRQSGTDTYTYTLYQADDTPLDDSDNPVMCTKSFEQNTPFDGYSYLGSVRWNTLCTIPATGPAGQYIVRVSNSGAVGSPEADGSNQWGIVAKYVDEPEPALCDGRGDANCPRVYGKDAISVRAASTADVASFYLAEIGPEHAGKRLRLELFDPGEGGMTIEIQKPITDDEWESVPLTWTSESASPSSGSGTDIDVTSNRFNGKLLEITVDLTGYSPPVDNNWWQIKYTFGGTVTDRTTWSARILGDPVHLIEEY